MKLLLFRYLSYFKNKERLENFLYLILLIPLFSGVTAGYWDITYHTLNEVDTFFQPAHLIIYTSLFTVLLIGIGIAVIGGCKSIAILSGVQLLSGFFDLAWHNNFGFDSFLSPPHVILSFIPILFSWIIFKWFNKRTLYFGQTISLAILWLSITFFLLIFSLASSKQENISFYIIPSKEVSFIISAIIMPLISVFVVSVAKKVAINPVYVSVVFAISMLISTLIPNDYVTFTIPFLICGTILPAIVYNKNWLVGSVLLGGLWIFTYVPYSFKIIAYHLGGSIVEIKYTLPLSYYLIGYYPLLIVIGIYVGIILYYVNIKYKIYDKIILYG